MVRARRWGETGIALGMTLGLVAGGYLYKGVPAAQMLLNDGGVWVVNSQLRLLGHLNAQSRTLDGGLRAASNTFDVLQAAGSVLLDDVKGDALQRIDPSTVTIGGQLNRKGLSTSHGGGLLMVADPDAGKAWALRSEGLASFNPEMDPTVGDVAGATVTTSVDGRGFVVTPKGELREISPARGETYTVDSAGSLDSAPSPGAELTTVGHTVVALDRTARRLITPKATIALSELGALDGVRLQPPGPDADRVLLATPDALLAYPLGGGDAERTPASGAGIPADPVFHEGCAYAVWGGTGSYLRNCPGSADDISKTYREFAGAKDLSFRTNRRVIVINDNANGTIYLPNNGMAVVRNWDLVKAQVDKRQSDEATSGALDEVSDPKYTDQQHPPVANDDEFGVRVGTATTLPVLANDTDPDGDVLTVVPEALPKGISVVPTPGDRGFRVDLPANPPPSFSFTYRAFDGRDRSAPATVKVRVRPAGSNEPPRQLRVARLSVSERASVTYALLADWVDPDGDQIYLQDAAGTNGLKVTFRQDGTVTVKDLGTAGPGTREVAVTVSDGAQATQGTVRLQVKPRGGNQPPIANADHYWGVVGQTLRVAPLSNDTDPDGDELALTELAPAARGTRMSPDYGAGTFQFTADKVGAYVVRYSVSDGPSKATNEVRIDVTDPKGDLPPVAENDLALLPEGSTAVVDILANDNDPRGGVLVVQGVNVPQTSALSVEVLGHERVRVSAPANLRAPEAFTYTVSNGRSSATARVMVIPVPAGRSSLPPVAVDDEATVRAGDLVAVPVLGNDYSPTNMALTLVPTVELAESAGKAGGKPGEAFVSGDLLRFRAGQAPGQARVTYTIRDSAGNVASAEVRITITAFDKRNQLPRPEPVEARVVAGNRISIPVPLDGVDPDGDSVQLTGLGAPSLGRATLGRGVIEYSAPDAARGTDSFTYTVRDRFGGEGSATVRVGVAPAPATNQNPVAVLDAVAARPGHEIEVDVTANDVDPDGDAVALVAGSVEPVDKQTSAATTIVGQKVRVTTPQEPGVLQYYYKITDGNGGAARGVITVKVDATVPPLAPIAKDDPLTPEDVKGKTEVSVDVLTNDSDPDGSTGALELTVESPGTVVGDTVKVTMTAERQVLLYTITDPDGLTARAAVVVPGADQVPPTLNPERVPATVKGGQPLVVDLATYVLTRPGHTAMLTSSTAVSAGPAGRGAKVAVTGDRALTFTPDKAFVGDTFVAFEVTDGQTLDDPRGLRATLTLPVRVESAGLTQPTFRPGEASVPPGEKPEAFDLRGMVSDPDPGDLPKITFAVTGVTGPFTATVDGGDLMVSAKADAAPGTKGVARITLTDGSTEPVTGTIPLTVVISRRPLITTRDAEIRDARSGALSTLSLTPYVTNPYADRGGDVSLVGQPTVTPSGAGSVTFTGLDLAITPAATFDGQLVVSYVVKDATGDPRRHATGVVRVTVKGNPDPPATVQAVTNASQSATVSWTAGDLRGGTLKKFTVYWAGGSKDCGLQTVCELTRVLQNNRDYTFTVTQTTDVAESTRSLPSPVVRPDVKPNTPGVPVARFGDKSISLTWVDGGVPDGGSPVDRYTVEIRPAAGAVTQRDVTTPSLTWTGLTNGTAYEFRVVAHNKFEKPSEPSGYSAPEVPAGAPGAPGAPRVVKDPVSAAAPRATVSWAPPDNANGDTSFTYELRRTGTSTVIASGATTSATVTMAVATEDQTFEVRATNKSLQWGPWSPASNAVRAFQPPGTPTGFALTATGADNTARFSFGTVSGNGAKASEITYQWSAGGASGLVTSGQSVTNGAFRNGVDVAVQLRAISTVNGEQAQGQAVSASVNAYGPPRAPATSATGNVNDVTLRWDATGAANGRSVNTVEVDTSDGVSSVGQLSGSYTQGSGRNQTKCIRARARDAAGQWGAWSSQACAATWGSPTQHFYSSGIVKSTGIYWVSMDLRAWNPNSRVRCDTQGVGGFASWYGLFAVDGNGNYSGPASGNAGGNGRMFSAPNLINDQMSVCVQQ